MIWRNIRSEFGAAARYVRWWFRTLRCDHPRTRGVYGDEIVFAAGGKRRKCLECGRYVDGWA